MPHLHFARSTWVAMFLSGVVLFLPVDSMQGEPERYSRPQRDNPGTKTIYVDGSTGQDTNQGTSSQPLRTLAAAARIALGNYGQGVATMISIKPGVYREAVSMNYSGRPSSAGVSFVAASGGTVVMNGADLWNGWQPDPIKSGVYTHQWTFHWGPCNVPKDWPELKAIVARREIVFVNGAMLKQVLSANELSEGTFFVDEGSQQIKLYPPAGTDMASAPVEIGVRPHLLNIHGISNLTVSGMVFTKAATCLPGGSMELFDSSNDAIENSQFNWNNWQGLVLHNVSQVTIHGLQASYNGGSGLLGYQIKSLMLEGGETSYNNWRGDWGSFYFFSQAGTKLLRVHDSKFQNFRAVNNQTSGLWFDTDNANVRIENANLSFNRANGLFLEANQGPIILENSRICQNRAEGVLVLDTDGVFLRKNLLYSNKGAQILADGRQKSRSEHDWETRANFTSKTRNLNLEGNIIVGTIPDQLLFKTYQVDVDSTAALFSTLSSDSNTWYNATTPRAFQYDPELSGGRKVHNMDFAGWQSFTGLDKNSKFAAPGQDPAQTCAKP
jgi:hypothetical protein